MLVRATITGQYGGQKHINVLHFQQDDVTSIIYFSLAARIADFWVDFHRINVDNNMRWSNIHIEPRSSSTDPPYDYPITMAGVLGPSQQYASFICACFLFHTDLPGRRGRGRTFVGGYGHTSQFNSSQWLSGTQNRLDGVATELTNYWIHDNINTDGWKLCVASRQETVSGSLVTRITGRSFVSTMNTRKVGRGA